MDRRAFDEIPFVSSRLHCRGKALVIGVLATLCVGACLIVGLVVGVVKFWPSAWDWAQKELGVPGTVRELATQLGYERLAALGRGDRAALIALAGLPAMEQLQKWTSAAPEFQEIVRNGAYLKALQEAARQKAPDISQIDLTQVTSVEVRDAVAQVQRVLRNAPQVVAAAAAVNPAVVELLGSDAFLRLSRDPNFSRLMSPGRTAEIDE